MRSSPGSGLSVAWFDACCRALQAAKERVHVPTRSPGLPPRCPCCRLPALEERAACEICPVCWWEDDGQDDPHADEVWGGANGDASLSEARAAFDDVVARAGGPAGTALRGWLDAVRGGEAHFGVAHVLGLLRAAEDAGSR